jgi:hypothetical protein
MFIFCKILEVVAVTLYLVFGALFIILSDVFRKVMRCMVFAYHVSYLLLLRWQISFYIQPLRGQPLYEYIADNKNLLFPVQFHEKIKRTVLNCINSTNINVADVNCFLLGNMRIYKLVSLMNCSCMCRYIKRNSHEPCEECRCCFRHTNKIWCLYSYVISIIFLALCIIRCNYA